MTQKEKIEKLEKEVAELKKTNNMQDTSPLPEFIEISYPIKINPKDVWHYTC